MLKVPKLNRYIINAVALMLLLLLQAQSAYSQANYLTPERLEKFLDCTKDVNDIPYPEERIFLEAQSWWTPTDPAANTVPGDTLGIHNFGHMHVGTCFPYKQTIRGNVDFEVVLTFHDYEPGTYLMNMRPHIFNPDFGAKLPEIGNPPKSAKSVSALVSFEAYPGLALKGANGLNPRIESTTNIPGTNVKGVDIGALCQTQGVDNINTIAGDTIKTCKLGLKFTMDTRQAPLDGLQEFRFITIRQEPDGREMHVSTGWQARLNNGDDEVPISRPGTMQDTTRDVSDYYHKFIEGKGWYTGSNYISNRVFDDPNYDGGITNHPMPSNPIEVNEEWHPTVQTNNGAGAGGKISLSQVFINPNFHDGDPDDPLTGSSVGPASLNKIMDMNELTITTDTPGVKHDYNRLVVVVNADCEVDGHNDLDENGVDDPSIDINSSGIRSDDCQCDDPKAQGVCNAIPLPWEEFVGQRSTGIIVVPFYVNKPTQDTKPTIVFTPYGSTSNPVTHDGDLPVKILITDNDDIDESDVNINLNQTDDIYTNYECINLSPKQVECNMIITDSGRFTIYATDEAGQTKYKGSQYIINEVTDTKPTIVFTPYGSTSNPVTHDGDLPVKILITDNDDIDESDVNINLNQTDDIYTNYECINLSPKQVECNMIITDSGRFTIYATDEAGQTKYKGSQYIIN